VGFFGAADQVARARQSDRLGRDGKPVRILRCVRRLPGGDGTTVDPAAANHVARPRKEAWEAQHGGEAAARPFVRARMSAWPSKVLSDTEIPSSDDDFLRMVARDTWRGLAAFTDKQSGLPVDNVRFEAGPADHAPSGSVGDYTSGTNMGLYLAAAIAAHDLGLIAAEELRARVSQVLATLTSLETYKGFTYNFYDTTSLERSSNFVSFIDAAWLLAGLIAVRAAIPELAEHATRLIDTQDFRLFHDARKDLVRHGYWVHRRTPSIYHYGVFYSEARLGILLAIGKGDIPASAWRSMLRVPPPLCARSGPLVTGFLLTAPDDGSPPLGYYAWENFRYVPSWGGSMFEALMPTLLIDEMGLSPRGLGRNDRAHVRVQRRYATNELGYPVWGMSPSSRVGLSGYGEFGASVLGARGYTDGVVTPHASALALAVDPREATRNLRELAKRFPIYGEFGFYDAVEPATGRVARAYLTLDQAMVFLSVANALNGGRLRARFASDPIVAAALPLVEAEEVPFE
jgi:hypothetical protein